MAKFFKALDDKLNAFIAEQNVFFVASAPAKGGHVNLSPKGGDTFRLLGPNRACYLDLTGSGNETAAHLIDNGRLTIMFCSFIRLAQILRLFGTGRVVGKKHPDWDGLCALFPDYPGRRQIVVIDIDLVQTSCGYQVPLMDFAGERDTLAKWAESKGPEGLIAYRSEKNALSLDGLPTGIEE
ncbi:MAG: pyridoxamine 5'-phosphate oxidase family protein [Alphaproteobacteria bacterium]|nr:pyridoxamine 5'-phosphate oxidase family protein [Alphaproteobacteria bacterium]